MELEEDVMPRSEARIFSAIWAQEDWRKLPPDAQWAYLMLLSQSDLAQDGVISLREGRWARLANGRTVADIRESLNELAAANWVVIDDETGELLVRSLIRWDRVFTQPNIMRAAISHLVTVESRTIRRAIYVELMRIINENTDEARLGREEKALSEVQKAAITAAVSALQASGDAVDLPGETKGFGNPLGNPSGKGSAKGSGEGSANPLGDRGKGKELKSLDLDLELPRASAHTREAEPLFAAEPPAPPPPSFDDFWAAYPRGHKKRDAAAAWARAVRRADPAKIVVAARRYADDPGREDTYTALAASWLNGDRWNDPPLPPRSSGHQSRSSAPSRLSVAMDLAAELMAEDNARPALPAPLALEADWGAPPDLWTTGGNRS